MYYTYIYIYIYLLYTYLGVCLEDSGWVSCQSRKDELIRLHREATEVTRTLLPDIMQGGAPQVISWFIIPLTIDISPINHSYWSYKPT